MFFVSIVFFLTSRVDKVTAECFQALSKKKIESVKRKKMEKEKPNYFTKQKHVLKQFGK
jgi:hypothetical protein